MTFPAETTAVAAAIALLIARAAGVKDADTITAIAVVIGALPGIVTGFVTIFGKRRLARATAATNATPDPPATPPKTS